MDANLHELFNEQSEDSLPLNKIEHDNVVKITIEAFLEDTIYGISDDLEKNLREGFDQDQELEVSKSVCYHTGLETYIGPDGICPTPAEIMEKVNTLIQKIWEGVNSIIFGDQWAVDEVVTVKIEIETVRNTYSQVVCENCKHKLPEWIQSVYLDIYKIKAIEFFDESDCFI